MASLFEDKKRGKWYLQFYDASKRPKMKKVPLKVDSRKHAESLAAKLRFEYEMGKFDPWNLPKYDRALTISEVAAAYIGEREGLREKTVTAYLSEAKLLAESMGVEVSIHQISAEALKKRIFDPDASSATKVHRYKHLNVLFRWAHKNRLLETNPLDDINPPKLEKRLPRYLSGGQLESFIQFVEDDVKEKYALRKARGGDLLWLSPLIQLAVYSGMRRGELISLDWEDVDFERGYINVKNNTAFKTKSGHERAIPMIEQAKQVLTAWGSVQNKDMIGPVFTGKQGRRLNQEMASKRFRDVADRAGLKKGFRFHDLRHTCASFLVAAGVSDRIASTILGHSDKRMMDVYAHLRGDTLVHAMNSAFNT